MSLLHLARSALSMGPLVVLEKVLRVAGRRLKQRMIGKALRRQCTYPDRSQVGGPLRPRLAAIDPALLAPHAQALHAFAKHTREHRFDLLGSGWVRVERGTAYAGFGPWKYPASAPLPKDWRPAIAAEAQPGNCAYAASLLAMIEDSAYRPIDWHVDFKSGYRWPTRVWGGCIAYGHKPGVDVKVPWELARLQHLPRLALAYGLEADPALAAEFRHQVLDFLAANPPGWGVNWACAMDVAIRAANMVLAWDLFRAHGAAFDDDFESELAAALLAHGRHLVHYLEWNADHRGNHYLADICGLAFIAAYLPRSAETDLWLAFSVQQLAAEIPRQFGPDGANFEASTAYHRLSAEMALFTAALIVGLPDDKRQALGHYDAALWRFHPKLAAAPTVVDLDVFARLAAAARFAQDCTKPSGDIVQIGDNDSGRFFTLAPSRNVLDVGHLSATAQGLFDLGVAADIDTQVIAMLANGIRLAVPTAAVTTLAAELPGAIATEVTRVVILAADPAALDGLTAIAHGNFGLFLWKNSRSFVSVRCGPIGCNGLGAHAHNDQLAVEVEIDGIPFARDPGTFVYTPDLAARNRYRSAHAHFVPRSGDAEPARLNLGPFRLEDRARARAWHFSATEFVGSHQGFDAPVWRRVRLEKASVVIEDCTGGPVIGPTTRITEYTIAEPAELSALWGLTLPFSPGYGLQQ